jgi:hypothetical protein
VHHHGCARQHAHINATDAGNVQETVCDLRYHHANGIHVGSDQDRWPGSFRGLCAGLSRAATFESMQGTHAADGKLIDQRPPLVLNIGN